MTNGKHGLGMGTRKCAKNPSTQSGLRKNAQTGNYEKVKCQTMPTGKCLDEAYDRKGQDTDIDTTRSIDNVVVELDDEGNIIEFDNIPENADKFKSSTYQTRIDNLRNEMNEERSKITNKNGKSIR